MISLNLREIASAISARPVGGIADAAVCSIAVDSREVVQNGVFIALRGERFDGHDFVAAAANAGCAAAVVEREMPDYGITQLVVESSFKAVGDIGRYIRVKSGIPVVGITGSVGKTSVKELTAAVLSQGYSVLKTEGNFNNELGLPRTLFRLEPEHTAAVLEMGISHFGEMSRLASIAMPDIAVFTNIENVHTEHLADRRGVLRAKMELVEHMRGNTLILNGDDDMLRGCAVPSNRRAIYYGLGEGCDVTACDICAKGIQNTEFTLVAEGKTQHVTLPAAGLHMVKNALAAAAAGISMGISLADISQGISAYSTVGSRMRIIRHNGFTILDDCYNASPASMSAALNVLGTVPGRRIALLGDMLELGKDSQRLHYQIGELAGTVGVDKLITVGEGGKAMASGAVAHGVDCLHIDREQAAPLLVSLLKEGDTLLVKASHGVHLETVVKDICNTERK